MATLKDKLSAIQTELNAPKNLKNNFGGFTYRNVESILEALKPLITKHSVSITLNDSLESAGERVYIKATATIYDNESADSLSVSAYAREAQVKKGMDEAQITGSASSYARKYALGGLLLLDDNKDIDSQDNTQNHSQPAKVQKSTSQHPAARVADLLKRMGLSMEDIKHFMEAQGVTSSDIEALETMLKDEKALIESAKAFMLHATQEGLRR